MPKEPVIEITAVDLCLCDLQLILANASDLKVEQVLRDVGFLKIFL